MAEQNLGNAIELLRMENAKQSQEQVSSTDKINTSLEKFLDNVKAMAGDREEERRDKKKKGKEETSGGGLSKTDFTGGFGLKGLLAGITVAVAGFATGIATYFKLLVKNVIPKSFTNAFKNIQNAFRAGTNGVKGLSKAANGAFRSLNTIEKGIRALGVGFQSAVNGLQSAGKSIKGGFLKAVNGIKSVILFLAKPFIAINKALTTTTGGVGALSKISTTIGEFFKGIGTKIKGFTDLFGKSGFLGKIFSVFRVLGTKLPIIGQIIAGVMAIFDGFGDAAKEVSGFGSKIIRFLTSGFGTFVGVIIGGIGDLVKWVVSGVAGLLGFDQFSKFLDSFSFEEIIVSIFDSLGTTLINAKNFVSDALTGGFDNFMSKLPTIIKNVLDYTIFAIPTLLSKAVSFIGEALGFDMSMLEGFSPTVYISNLMNAVTEMLVGAFDWIVDKVTNFDFGATLGAALDWGHEMLMKLKSIIAGVLPDKDSWAGKIIPDAVYDYLDKPAPEKVEPSKEDAGTTEMDVPFPEVPVALTQEDVIGITPEQQTSNMSSMQEARDIFSSDGPIEKDDFHVVTPKEINDATKGFIKTMEDPKFIIEASEKRKKREEEFAVMEEESKKKRLSKEEKLAVMAEKRNARMLDREKKYLEMKETGMKDGKKLTSDQMGSVDRSLERIEAIRKYRGKDVDNMSRENARSGGAGAVTVVAPSSQNVTNNNSQSTAAIMSQNQPTVDQNDRTYAAA